MEEKTANQIADFFVKNRLTSEKVQREVEANPCLIAAGKPPRAISVDTKMEDGTGKFGNVNVDKMFSTETPGEVMLQMSSLAEKLAINDEEIKGLDKKLRSMKAETEVDKEQMHQLMMANNCAQGHKFDSLIYLKPKIKEDVFKNKEIENDVLFAWLTEHGLGDIIKPSVQWQTLSSTMKEYMNSGNKLPEILNLVQKRTVHFVGNGKAKFLAAREVEL